MGERLLTWLVMRLGVVTDFDPVDFGTHAADGTLIARLLQSYAVITAEQVSMIEPSTTMAIRLRNLQHLRTWLKFLSIQMDDEMINKIAHEKSAEAVRLFYELYLCLENKQALYQIKHLRGKELYSALNPKFTVRNVPEEAVQPSKETFNPLSEPLARKATMIEWYRDKCKHIVNTIKIARLKFAHFSERTDGSEFINIPSKQNVPDTKLTRDKEDVNYLKCGSVSDFKDLTYEELMKLQAHGQMLSTKSSFDLQASKNYVSVIKKRSKKEAAHKAFKSEMQRLVLTELWPKLELKKDKEFNAAISEKLLKQSQYEKQITTKLYNIRNEKKIIIENKRRLDKMELQKREEEATASFERAKTLVEDYKFEQQFDKEMNLELHRRLYKERMDMKEQERLLICKEIVNDIADIAICAAEFRNTYDTANIPDRVWDDWKLLFLGCQPILESMTTDEEEIEIPVDKTEAILERQEALNENDLIDYICLINLFALSRFFPDIYERGESPEKLTLLGYIVHRLMSLKHPRPPLPIVPDLPPVIHAIAVIGLEDERAISILTELLRKQNIHVIKLDFVINFCLDAYRQEAIHRDDIDTNLILTSKAAMDELRSKPSKKEAKGKKANVKVGKVGRKNEKPATKDEGEGSGVESPVQERATQTPRNIPEEDGALSSRGELGKKAFEILSIGEQIPDSLLMEMFIEFLKNTQDIRGWVLLNYPLTFSQASELEEHLLGIRFPFLDEGIETMEQIEGIVKREVVQATAFIDYDNDNYMESRLLPNPIPEPKADIPRTYLTKFISVKKKKMEPDSVSEVEGVEIIEENMCPVSAFYVDQGVYYSFYHDVFDFPTVKQLARTILEEEGAEPAPSTELFGQEVKGLEEKFAAIEKKGKPPSSKKKSSKQFKSEEEATKEVPKTVPVSEVNGKNEEVADEEVKEKKKKNRERGKEKGKEQGKGKEKGNGKEKGKGKKEKGAGDAKGTKSKKEDGEKQEGHSEPGEVIPKDENKDSVKVESEIGLILASEVALERNKTLSDKNAITEEEPAKPGEDGWQYVDLEIPEPVSAYLATLWENAEDVYIKDFKEVFHYKRVHYYAIFPYLNTVKQNILNFIVRPDSKQQLVDDFQKNYNNIDDDLREDIEMKNELHCRVSELRDNLWNICDQRKKEAENERQRIINDNWVAEEMGCILNLNICCMQLEIDRCVDMLQVIQDYYVSMLKNLPMFSLINKIQVPRLSLGESEHDSRTPNYNYNSKGVRSVSSNIISGVGYTEVVVKMLIDLNVDKPYSTPFHKMVLETSSKVINYAKKLRTECMDILHREEEQILPKDGGKGKKQKEKMDKKKGNKQKEGQIEKDLESEKLQALREVSKRLFEEWEEALWDEIERTQFRVKLLQLCMIDELDNILDQALEMFRSLHDDIAERYNAEVDSVRSLCNLICRAIETEIPIQQQLVLDQDKFYIRPDTLLFPPPPEPTSEPIEERIINDEFRIVQLGKLMEKFKEIAPDGTIPQRALVYMLEDLIVCEPEGHILPNLWYQLRPEEIANVIDRIFSYGEFVDWKDFLIYGLNFEFPTMDELLLLRQKFKSLDPQSTETVSLENYHRVRFRYQEQLTKDPQSSLRENIGMEFLYCLFQVADDAINYSALLLYFCKDKIPQKGLAKAIALCLGKRVFSSGAEYIAYKVIEDALSMQMELSKHIAESVTRNIIGNAVERAIQQVDGVVITEVASASSEEFQKEVTYEQQEEITVNSSGSVLKGTSSIISPNNRSVDEASSGVLGGKVSGSNQSVIEHNGNDDSSMPISNEEFLPEYSIRVPYDVILTIFSVCLSWHVQAPEIIDGRSLIQVLNDVYKDLKVDGDSVYIHEFLDHPYIGQILSKVHKFKSCDIAKEIREVLNMRSLSS